MSGQDVYGQVMVKIGEISFEGQKRTKENVMLRELTIASGDSILLSELSNIVEENRQRLLNTTLFTKVEANLNDWTKDNVVDIVFKMREQWPLTGYAIFDLADRNFNVWWTEQNRSLKRVNYGFRASHDNLTGNRDKLTTAITWGYTRKIELEYNFPGINKERTLGMRTKIYYARNPETNYTTELNKFLFYRGEDFQLETFVAELGWQYRKKLDVTHSFDLEYHNNKSSDTLGKVLNPNYFLNGNTEQRAIAMQYSLVVDKRREKPYAKKGWYLKSILRKDGIGIFKDRNALTVNTTYAQFLEFSPKWSLELIGKLLFYVNRDQQPYFNSRSFGSKPDYLRGYELYVIDGMDFTYLQSSLRYQIVDWEWDNKMIDLFQRMRLFPIPIQVYLSMHSDLGYVNDPFYQNNNPLSNELLYGAGVGVDIVAYYNKVLQIQYSFNHLLESGIFLHTKYRF